MREQIEKFLSSPAFAVAGASNDRHKYGNKVGIQNIWVQPGAENQEAIENGLKNNINMIAHGPCLLVE